MQATARLRHLNIDAAKCRFQSLVGTGAIGSALIFGLDGNHTLGREESRTGRFLKHRDYCKLHIVCHYLQTLLGPGFRTLPISRIGDDELGARLLREMKEAGIDVRHVGISPTRRTLLAVCLIYPDGSGGNLTPVDSACAEVDTRAVDRVESDCRRFAGRGIALALPEVPLAARERLLIMGTEHRFFRVASFNSSETLPAIEAGLLRYTDLVTLNIDEALTVAALPPSALRGTIPAAAVVDAALARFRVLNPNLIVSITAGNHGSWLWDGQMLSHVPAIPIEVKSAAGAGDAYLAGILAGLTGGLRLAHAQQLGTLVAALSVTSPDTLHKDIDAGLLREFATRKHTPTFDKSVMRLLSEPRG